MSRASGDRLAAALSERYGDAVKITHSQGLIVFERGNARTTAPATHGGDRRSNPEPRDVADTALKAASRLARDVPHYKPEFVDDARELVDILRAKR